ncbi:DUF4232 domain-containing protein [Streptomyces sp. NPDC048639]|uniref:DUF4232 domain-containing protein n=1 Tax=Streptomyces sp. NPDC048639 TaxID=3365581 RepID=UPI0037107E62
MRSRLSLYAAGTVLAACSLVLSGCNGDEDSAGAPASTASSAESGKDGGNASDGKGDSSGGKENADDGGSSGSTAGQGEGGSNHLPDAPACTDKNSTVTVVASNGTGKAHIKLVNNGDKPCSVVGTPSVELLSAKDKTLNPDAVEAQNQETHLIQVDGSGFAIAELDYEGGTVSEGGSQDGITCGYEAVSAVVSLEAQQWTAEVRTNESGGIADSVPGGMIVCDPKSTVGPFHD